MSWLPQGQEEGRLNPDWVISSCGVAEQGCVFQTPGDTDPATEPATWVVTEHHPDSHHIEMVKIIPQHSVMKLTGRLKDDGEGGTLATISYEYTSLGPDGDRFLKGCDEDWYRQFMHGWEAAMNHYLATGEMMTV